MKIIFSILMLFTWGRLFCQSYSHVEEASSNPFLNDANGRPLYLISNYTIEGSPYFMDEYRTAQLVAVKGIVYNNVKVKINIVERVIQYLGADGKEMVTDIPVKRLVFRGLAGGTDLILEGFSTPLNMPGAGVYQVLDTGKIKLLKKIVINARDEKKYGNAGITRVYERKEYYYSAEGVNIRKLEKGKAAMLELFNHQKDTLSTFIEAGQLNCRSEQDYQAVFRFCNSL